MPTIAVQPGVIGDDGHFTNEVTVSFSTTSTTLGVGDSSSTDFNRCTFLRFPGLAIPVGATIDAATITCRAAGLNGTIPPTTIDGVAADSPAAPISRAEVNAFARTTAEVAWTPSAWVTNTLYPSPDISAVIQEIVDRPGWVSGNALILIVNDGDLGAWAAQNRLAFVSKDHATLSADAVTLSVTFTEPGGVAVTNTRTLQYHMNRKAGTLVGDVPTLDAQGAANVWAGTTNMDLVGALNVEAGNSLPEWKELVGVLNQLAGTTGLEQDGAAASIP